ncbi:MAG: OmpA family protein [Deltaproteobacteria bacterium]|nr:OmpA family protein [Deltaproteobacteria bacterium]
MGKDHFRASKYFVIAAISLLFLFPALSMAEETSLMTIEAAKSSIEQAKKAGAEQHAMDTLSAAKSWLNQAEKAYSAATSIMAKISTPKMRKAREEEIIYLATMSRLKGLTAEAVAKKTTTAVRLKEEKKDLVDYQSAIVVMKEKLQQAEKAKEVQAKAEAERKKLEESQRAATEIEAQKQKELLDAQRKTAELEAMKQREIQEARLQEAEREKRAAEAKMKEAQLGAQRAQEAMESKAREEKLAEEKMKLAAVQERLQALEQEKAMLTAAGKIPKVTAKAGDKSIVMTVLVIHLFTSAGDLSSGGKEILDNIASYLKTYRENSVIARGHTDSTGKQATNQALSEKRAQKVREYLVAYQNISPERIKAEGIGPAQPAASNASEAGRALNRRVELVILTSQP